VADPESAITYTGSDTIDRGLLAIAGRTPVNVSDYGSFVARHPEFRVYTAGSGWVLDRLERAGAAIDPLAEEPGGRLLLVRP
jgi:hypothetical protein